MRHPTAFPALAAAALASVLAATGSPARAQKSFDRPPQMAPAQPAPSQPAAAPSTRFTLVNDSTMVIDNLNISPVSDDKWGDDLFGTLSLPARSRIIAGPAQTTGCLFDVRIVYHDHREEVLRRQNLCNLDTITFTGRNARVPRERSQSDD